jgi:nitrogen-specific signal transduction histidine kinase
MRSRILTDHERRMLKKYLDADGEKDPLMRSLARYAKQSLAGLRGDLQLLERFYETYTKRNSKGQSHQ